MINFSYYLCIFSTTINIYFHGKILTDGLCHLNGELHRDMCSKPRLDHICFMETCAIRAKRKDFRLHSGNMY